MGLRFNTPPGWPEPPTVEWLPAPGWQPDPAWPAPPPGWKVIEKTRLSRPRNIFLLIASIVGSLILLSSLVDSTSRPDESGQQLSVEINGITDDAPESDVKVLTDYNSAVRDWNSVLGPIITELNDPYVQLDEWLPRAAETVTRAGGYLGIMRATGAQARHDGLRDLLLDRADVYNDELRAFNDIVAAISSGDTLAQKEARQRLVISSDEGQALARVLTEGMQNIQDALVD